MGTCLALRQSGGTGGLGLGFGSRTWFGGLGLGFGPGTGGGIEQ